MERVMVVVVSAFLLVVLSLSAAFAMCPPPNCGPQPQQCYVTRMVPCTRTEMVAQVVPCTRTIMVQKVGYKTQSVLVRGTPVGMACGQDPCTKCCPQPFCETIQQKVPYYYAEPVSVPWYNVVYKPVCRPVMLPQTYLVETIPMCGR